jgi:hypothetical protein
MSLIQVVCAHHESTKSVGKGDERQIDVILKLKFDQGIRWKIVIVRQPTFLLISRSNILR